MLSCAEQVQIQKYETRAYKTLKTVGVQLIMLEYKDESSFLSKVVKHYVFLRDRGSEFQQWVQKQNIAREGKGNVANCGPHQKKKKKKKKKKTKKAEKTTNNPEKKEKLLLLLLLSSPARSLGFTILGEFFEYVTIF